MRANNLVQALNLFNPKRPLLTQEELDNYFVARPKGSLVEMETYLRGIEEEVKILFTGHRGSGKSTELNKLTSLLSDKFFIVRFSIAQSLNLYDINYVDVILAMALKLFQKAHEHKVKINKSLLQDVFDWLTKEIAKEVIIEIPKEASLSANINLLAVKIEGKFGGETLSRTIMREKIEPRLSELMERINLTIDEIKRKTNKYVLIIVEDIDKADLDKSRHLFFEHGISLSKINARVIYTFPIALRYSNDFPQIAHNFNMHFVLPNVKIFNKQGKIDDVGYQTLKSVILKRLRDELIEKEALDEIIQLSGGLMVELIRLVHGAANYALSEKKIIIDIESVNRMANEIRNDYRALLRPKHYEILNRTKKDKEKRIVNEEIVQELLHNLSLLEYRNDETWGDVHPIVKPLLK
jgi:energy-coupling factor transporter ATP-binding protein EcfA2